MRTSLFNVFRGVSPLLVLLIGVLQLGGPQAMAQQEQLVDRPVSSIRFAGLERVSEQKIVNNIRSRVGAPYEPSTARGDVSRLTRLGDFSSILLRPFQILFQMMDSYLQLLFVLVKIPILDSLFLKISFESKIF